MKLRNLNHHAAPTLPGNRCPSCGRARLEVNGQLRRHCPNHEIQVNAA